ELFKSLRLASRGEDRAPPTTRGVEAFGVRGEEFDGHVDETLVQEADDDAGLASHRGVHCIAREEVAEQRIFAVRRTAADLVTRVEVTHHDRDALSLEERLDFLA